MVVNGPVVDTRISLLKTSVGSVQYPVKRDATRHQTWGVCVGGSGDCK